MNKPITVFPVRSALPVRYEHKKFIEPVHPDWPDYASGLENLRGHQSLKVVAWLVVSPSVTVVAFVLEN